MGHNGVWKLTWIFMNGWTSRDYQGDAVDKGQSFQRTMLEQLDMQNVTLDTYSHRIQKFT